MITGELLTMLIAWNDFVKVEDDHSSVLNSPEADERRIHLNANLYCFYVSEELNPDGFPQNGALWEDGEYRGTGTASFFDMVYGRSDFGLVLIPESEKQSWIFRRNDSELTLTLSSGKWSLQSYRGSEPDWGHHPFPFRNLPESTPEVRHAYIRGLLDFFAGTRKAHGGTVFQAPNTSIGKGYCGDGIPDTFFQFISAYPYLSERRRSYFRSQIEWLGDHMRFDGCIPWGGCNSQPYYHIWKREDCGLFFDGNGLWLEMVRRLSLADKAAPDLAKVVRAADFYLHYMTEDGLVAAESKKKGCEWADLLQNGWHSSLINVIAYRGLRAAESILSEFKMPELADRYARAATRLKNRFNQPVSEGGFWRNNGYIDWRDKDGTVHPHWRIDANMLAIVWDVAAPEQKQAVIHEFKKVYFKDEPAVPAPYLLYGSWMHPVDDMLEGCRTFGCGCASMPGRMGGAAVAALRMCGEDAAAERIFTKLVHLVNHETAIYEYYGHDGAGEGQRSYVEHALGPLLASAFLCR